MKSPYDTLGVDIEATDKEIKKAYHKQAHTTHPDKGGSAKAFHKINQAYAVLICPEKREHYDRTGEIKQEAPDNTTALALERVSELIINALSHHNHKYDDIITACINQINTQILELRQHIQKVNKNKKILAEYKSRFKFKGKKDTPNYITEIIENHINNTNRDIAITKQKLKTVKIAKGILENYDYDFDTNSFFTFSSGGYSSGSSTTTAI